MLYMYTEMVQSNQTFVLTSSAPKYISLQILAALPVGHNADLKTRNENDVNRF